MVGVLFRDCLRQNGTAAGKHFDPSNPIVTVTLRDGSRLNAILPPVAKPLVITIRKQQLRRFLFLSDLQREGAIPATAIPILERKLTDARVTLPKRN